MAPPFSPTCPICGALVGPREHAGDQTHAEWHYATRTLRGWSTEELLSRLREQRRLAELLSVPAEDDAPTQKFPPIGETVLRRPPAPVVRELSGPELLRALAAEIERDLRDAEDQDDDGDES